EDPRYVAYNFLPLLQWENAPEAAWNKPTVEFRQHKGTLDSESVLAWIQVAVGIVRFCRDATAASFLDLVHVVKHETWEKLGDGRDEERERDNGPILAEKRHNGFNIFHLLERIGLSGPMRFYQKRGFYI
ncbi:hypothetical protein B0J14DRAFT_449226, partial [Halenospora varia]